MNLLLGTSNIFDVLVGSSNWTPISQVVNGLFKLRWEVSSFNNNNNNKNMGHVPSYSKQTIKVWVKWVGLYDTDSETYQNKVPLNIALWYDPL